MVIRVVVWVFFVFVFVGVCFLYGELNMLILSVCYAKCVFIICVLMQSVEETKNSYMKYVHIYKRYSLLTGTVVVLMYVCVCVCVCVCKKERERECICVL